MRYELTAQDQFGRKTKIDFDSTKEVLHFVKFYKLEKWFIWDRKLKIVVLHA